MKRLKSKLIGVDTETTGLQAYAGARAFAYSCAEISGNTFYAEDDAFPRHLVGTDKWEGNYPNLKKADAQRGPVRQLMIDWMADSNVAKVFHNAKFDIKMMRRFGIEVRGEVHDTMVMGHVLGAQGEAGPKWKDNCLKRLRLATLADQFLTNDKSDEVKKWLKDHGREFVNSFGRKPNYSDVPMDIMEEYARLDPFLTIELYHVFWSHLEADPDLMRTYRREMELMSHVIDMEERGFRMDVDFMAQRSKELTVLEKASYKKLVSMAPTITKRVKKTRQKNKVKYNRWILQKIKPDEINFGSDDQLIKIIYGHRKLPILHWTGLKPGEDAEGKTAKELGQPSVDERTLSRLDDPFCKEVVRYRQYIKLRDTYYEGYKNQMSSDGILHPNYNQSATQTGRFSSSDPNLQNIPTEKQVRERAGADVIYKGVKRAFIPRKGFTNFHFDYSGIEMRMFAHLVGTEQIIKAVTYSDIHDWATELLYGPRSSMTQTRFDYLRVLAKIMNFGILYGMGKKTFAWKLKKTLNEVNELLDLYYQRLPEVKELQHRVIAEVRQTGCLKNVFGRRYLIDPRYAYKGVNYLCQGSAADVLKSAMIRVGRYLKNKRSNALMTIHDEIVCEIHDSEVDYVPQNIVKIMQYQPLVKVPLKVSAEVALGNWENLYKLKPKELEQLCLKNLSSLSIPPQQ